MESKRAEGWLVKVKKENGLKSDVEAELVAEILERGHKNIRFVTLESYLKLAAWLNSVEPENPAVQKAREHLGLG